MLTAAAARHRQWQSPSSSAAARGSQPRARPRTRIASQTATSATTMAFNELDTALQRLSAQYIMPQSRRDAYERLRRSMQAIIRDTDPKFQAARVTIDGSLASGTATWESDADMTMRTDENVRVSRADRERINQALSGLRKKGYTPDVPRETKPKAISGVERKGDEVLEYDLVFERRLFDVLAKALRDATHARMTSDSLLRYLDSQLFNKPFDPSPLDVDGLTQQLLRLRVPGSRRMEQGDTRVLYQWLGERSEDFPVEPR